MRTRKKRSQRLRPIISAVAYIPSQHYTLKEASKQTGYEETYLSGSGAGRYGLNRFTSATVPMFFNRSEIDKLAVAMNGNQNGKSNKVNGHRPRPARLGERFSPARARSRGNGNPPIQHRIAPSVTPKGTITVVGNVESIRQLLSDGFNVKFEIGI